MESKQRSPLKSGLKVGMNILFYAVIVLLLIFSIANMRVSSEDQIPNVFGLAFSSVQSDSMKGDAPDSFDKGDLIFLKMLDDKSREDLDVDDIVIFYDRSIRAFNTHRIVAKGEVEGVVYITTRGDNTPGNDQPININDAIAVYQSSWSGAGSALDYLRTPVGFALFIIIPVFMLLVIQGVGLTRNILLINKDKMTQKYEADKVSTQELLEKEKDRLRQELLEEMKNQNNNKDS